MKTLHVSTPHTEDEIHTFALKMKISDNQAAFIDTMRDRYICFEYDYIKDDDCVETVEKR